MNRSNWTNAELLCACINTGATEEWAEFIARFQPLVAGVIARIVTRFLGTADFALIDDLVQETYVRLCRDNCRALREFRGEHEGSFFGYLKETASSVARDHFRAQNAARRGPKLASLDETTEKQAIDSHLPGENVLFRAELWRSLEKVADSDRDITVCKLYYQQGFTAKEISALPYIGLSEKGVESCLHRLVLLLRRELNSSGQHAGKPTRITLGDIG